MYNVYANTIQNLDISCRFKVFLKEAREGLSQEKPQFALVVALSKLPPSAARYVGMPASIVTCGSAVYRLDQTM